MRRFLSAFLSLTVFVAVSAPAASARAGDRQDEVRPVLRSGSVAPLNEIGVSYGFGSNSILIDVFVDILSAIAGARYESSYLVGPVGVEYFRGTGGIVSYGGILTGVRNVDKAMVDGVQSGTRSVNYLTLMPALKFGWIRKDTWGMYSKLGVGGTLRTSREAGNSPEVTVHTDCFVNFQASLIGFEFGRDVRGFVEGGWGEQGIVLAGLRFRF